MKTLFKLISLPRDIQWSSNSKHTMPKTSIGSPCQVQIVPRVGSPIEKSEKEASKKKFYPEKKSAMDEVKEYLNKGLTKELEV